MHTRARIAAVVMASLLGAGLAGCTNDDPSDAEAASAAALTAAQNDNAIPIPATTAPSTADILVAAMQHAGEVGDGGQQMTTATVTDLGTGPFGFCQHAAVELDSSGAPTAVDTTVGFSQSTDLTTMCDGFDITTHFIAIGPSAYVETPPGSGSYREVAITSSVLSDLGTTSAAHQVRQFETMLATATSIDDQGNGRYVVILETLDALRRAADFVGLDQTQIDQITSGTVKATYQVNPTTGLIDSVQLAASFDKGGTTITSTALTTAIWDLETPIAVPDNVTAADAPTASTLDELSTIALGTTP